MKTETSVAVHFDAAVPQFTVPDVVQTAEYYRDVLGFTIAGYWNGERASLETHPQPVFGIVQRDQVQVFFNRSDAGAVRTGRAAGAYAVYLRVTGLDALSAELRARGAHIVNGPEGRITASASSSFETATVSSWLSPKTPLNAPPNLHVAAHGVSGPSWLPS